MRLPYQLHGQRVKGQGSRRVRHTMSAKPGAHTACHYCHCQHCCCWLLTCNRINSNGREETWMNLRPRIDVRRLSCRIKMLSASWLTLALPNIDDTVRPSASRSYIHTHTREHTAHGGPRNYSRLEYKGWPKSQASFLIAYISKMSKPIWMIYVN